MVGDGTIIVKVIDVGADVEIWKTGRIAHDEPCRIEALEPPISFGEPGAMLGIFVELRAPVLIDDGPCDDRRVIAVPLQDALHRRPQPLCRSLAEFRDIGYFAPYQHAEAVRELIIAR